MYELQVVCNMVCSDLLRPGRTAHCILWSKNPGQKSGQKTDQKPAGLKPNFHIQVQPKFEKVCVCKKQSYQRQRSTGWYL